MENCYINIKEIAQAKGLKSTRSIRMEINKPESKYISREVKVNGGISYEILFSSLEPELQQKLRECETKSTAIVPLNYKPPVITDKARQTANHRMNIVKAALEHRNKYPSIKEADAEFLDLYNSGLYLPKAYEFLGSISIGTLRRYIQAYKKTGNAESLIPQYKITKQGEYNSILDDNMKKVLLALLLHQNKFGYNTAIRLAIQKGKYIAREVEVRGGKSYEILYSSLEAEVQEKLEDEEIKGTSLVPILNNEPTFISEKAKMTALARVDILYALLNIRGKYSTKKEADSVFLDLYNSGMLLPKVYNFIGSISKTTLYLYI